MKCKLLLLLVPFFLWAHPEENTDLFNKDDESFLISGEFLYWTVSEGALDYAIRMREASWGPSDSYAQGDMERAEFDWDPGYRFTVGYFRASNFWEAAFQWTYLHLKGSDQAKRPPADENRFMVGTFPQIFTDPVVHTTSHIHLHYELADLLANRVFFPTDNPHLRMKVVGGLTAVWMNQGWKVRYFDTAQNTTMIKNAWKYWGFGLRAGLSFDWFWGKDFYASGKATTALVLGHYKNHAKQATNIALQPGDNPLSPLRDLRYDDYRMSFTTQFLLGPSYQKSFTNWRYELFVGYELTIWTNLQEVFRSSAGSAQEAKETWINTGLVSLHGLSARASFSF